MKDRDDTWCALPREAARWWRLRTDATSSDGLPGSVLAHAHLVADRVVCSVG